MKVLTIRVSKLEKLQGARMQIVETNGTQQWNITLWSQQQNLENQFNFGDYVLWFSKGNRSHLKKFIKNWFGPYRIQYICVVK